MGNKGPSNRYGNTKGSKSNVQTRKVSYPWAKQFDKGKLNDHYNRHGKQVNAVSKEMYESKAVKFANTVDKKNNMVFVDKKGITYKYNTKTNEFAVIDRKGTLHTYFKPKDGEKYFRNIIRRKKNGK